MTNIEIHHELGEVISSQNSTYVLVGLTGRAQDICVMHVSLQLSSELSFAGVYPGTRGVSRNRSRNLHNPILKLSRVAPRC